MSCVGVLQRGHSGDECDLMSVTSTHTTHTIIFNCTHIRTTLSPLDLWTEPAEVVELPVKWNDKLAGGPQAGSSDSHTNKGQGSG